MARYFNTAGPCLPGDHYMLPPERRIGPLRSLIAVKAFFVVHAPRQTGKTTSLQSFARTLTAEGKYAAVHASCKPAALAVETPSRGMQAILRSIVRSSRALPEELRPPPPGELGEIGSETLLLEYLTLWSERSSRPVVLFLDEFDALASPTLQSALDQLHTGYTSRPIPFPQSVALIGLRDVRDYHAEGEGARRPGTASPFNIKLKSLRLRDFTAAEVAELYTQHTTETGQRFESDAIAFAFEQTRGQPWLVNALAQHATGLEADRDAPLVTRQRLVQAKEALILQRDTHLDSLVKRLQEPRIRKVLEPILAGRFLAAETLDDDIQFAKDLGLVNRGPQGLEIANPIYREIIPRALIALSEEDLPVVRAPYLSADGHLLFDALLDGFAAFWRQHAEHFLHRQPYSEAAAQLIFMAYLQRIVNGGSPAGVAAIDREYAIGSGRIDLCVRWPLAAGGAERFAVELKVWRDRASDPLLEGLEQLASYLERLDLASGTLMVFDRRSMAAPLPERIARSEAEHRGRTFTIWRL